MKKNICLLMIMVLVCLLVGCGNKESSTSESKDEKQLNKLREGEVGDTVKFGIKPNSDMLNDDSLWMGHDWEWIVLENDGEEVFLLSKDYLFECEYDDQPSGGYVYFDSHVSDLLCDLTDPLMQKETLFGNNTSRIKEVPIESSVGDGSQNVKFQFFLLSKEEVKKYLPNKEDRILKPEEEEFPNWWLRSSYKERDETGEMCADIVRGTKIDEAPVYCECYCRPACRVDISE